MRKVIIKFFLILLVINISQDVFAQITASTDKVLSAYLYNNKILISPTQNTTSVKFSTTLVTKLDATGKPNPGSITFKVYHINGSTLTALSGQQTVTHADFQTYQAILTREFTVNIDKTKLSGGVIDILYDTPGFPYPAGIGSGYAYTIETPVIPPPSSDLPRFNGETLTEAAPYQNSATLYKFFNRGGNFHMMTANIEEGNMLLQSKMMYNNPYGFGAFAWGFDGMIGYVKTVEETGTVPLYRYYRHQESDHYFSTFSITPIGYVNEGIECYVYNQPAPDRNPVFVYATVNPPTDHLYSLTSNPISGWNMEGIGFYVLK